MSTFNLRHFSIADLHFIHELESDPSIVMFTPMKIPQTLEQTKERLNRQIKLQEKIEPFGFWAAETVDKTKDFIGWFMLVISEELKGAELGFMVRKKYQKKGFATAVSKEIINKAFFELNQNSIFAQTDKTNIHSKKVLTKLGFTLINSKLKEEVFILNKK